MIIMHGQIKGKFIRTMYWVGIILDALVGIDILQTIVTGQSIGVFVPQLTEGITYLAIQVAVFMFGWTVLLYWGVRDPINRRALLLMTAFPVVVGLLASKLMVITCPKSEFTLVVLAVVDPNVTMKIEIKELFDKYAKSKERKVSKSERR